MPWKNFVVVLVWQEKKPMAHGPLWCHSPCHLCRAKMVIGWCTMVWHHIVPCGSHTSTNFSPWRPPRLGLLTFGYCSSNPLDNTFTGGLFNSSVATPSLKFSFCYITPEIFDLNLLEHAFSSGSYLYVNINQAWIQTMSCSKITEKHISLLGQ